MTIDDVRKLYWSEPFRPFRISLRDGRVIPVERREFLTIAAKGERITVCPRIEDFEIVDLPDVVDVLPMGSVSIAAALERSQ